MSEQYSHTPEISIEKKRSFTEKVLQKAPQEKAFHEEDWAYKVQYETNDTMVILTVPTEHKNTDPVEVLLYKELDDGDQFLFLIKKLYASSAESDYALYTENIDIYDKSTGDKIKNPATDLESIEGINKYIEILNDERAAGAHTFTQDKYDEVMSLLDQLDPEHIVTH